MGVEIVEPCNIRSQSKICSALNQLVITSPRDFGTGAKWHHIYAVMSTFLLFSSLHFPPIWSHAYNKWQLLCPTSPHLPA